jgi:rhamnulokinase
VEHKFLAFDLGAESGRAMLGHLRSGVLEIRDVHRFPNEAVRHNGSLQWDVLRLWHEIKRSLEQLSGESLESIGVDTWGCDFALVGEQGTLVGNPYHYRDSRTDGVMEQVFERVSREAIYAVTGIQFLPFNTLYQLYAACRATPRLVDAAVNLATIPDLFNYWLTGTLVAEYTNATTMQCVDAKTRSWATDLLTRLEIPTRLLPCLVEPGTAIGPLKADVVAALAGTPVIAPACHDTASAVAAVKAGGGRAFLSSGTWSLLGIEVPQPVITDRARDLNFTNEGGVAGTTRLLKNIAGMWLLQACRRYWAEEGHAYDYETLLSLAKESRSSFHSLFDPDHVSLLHPSCMPDAIAELCRLTSQPAPASPGEFARAILESIAFKYRTVLDALERLTGTTISEIQIVGGGSRNTLLNQFTADATGRTVFAGPIEATALGNIAVQMVSTGAACTLDEARTTIERSFPVDRYAPMAADRWEAHYRRFQQYVELTFV